MKRESWELGEKTAGWIAELLSDLGEIRKDECKEREEALERTWRKEHNGALRLRFRVFLNSLCLYGMTIHFFTIMRSCAIHDA